MLLGRQAAWPAGRYSALAGFVEPGESLEDAVAREVFEESGVEVGGRALCLLAAVAVPELADAGVRGLVRGRGAGRGDGELEDARWFTRAELTDAAAGRGELLLPPPLAIARRLIDGWLAAAP